MSRQRFTVVCSRAATYDGRLWMKPLLFWAGAAGGSACCEITYVFQRPPLLSVPLSLNRAGDLEVQDNGTTVAALRDLSGAVCVWDHVYSGGAQALGGVCCRGGGKRVRVSMLRFRGPWAAARPLLTQAQVPTMPCRRRAPSTAVNCGCWWRMTRTTRLPRRVGWRCLTRRGCSMCPRELSRICGCPRRVSLCEADCPCPHGQP